MKAKFFANTKTLLAIAMIITAAFSFNACKKIIVKAKKLEGTWKVTTYAFTDTWTEVYTSEYSNVDCGTDGSCTEEGSETESFSGTSVSGTVENDYSAGCSSNDTIIKYSGSISSYTIEFTEDGTYKVTITYSATCENSGANDFEYTGSITTDMNTYELGDARKKNSVLTLYNFPRVNFRNVVQNACSFGSAPEVDTWGKVALRIEKDDKKTLILKSEASESSNDETTRDYQVLIDFVNDTYRDCVSTTTMTGTSSKSWSYTLEKE